ncbi:MAG: hypothetical protein R2682_12775 [Pyrinomonadaceae bacterium]
MSVQQASYYCPVCQQQRLFTRQEMNHVPHLLVTLFSCGLYFFVWLLIYATYSAKFHCSQCGFADPVVYVANPYLRSQEAQLNADRTEMQGESSGLSTWFSGLTRSSKLFIIGLGVVVGVLFVTVVGVFSEFKNAMRKANTQANANSTANSSSSPTTSTPKHGFREPSTLSSAENLEEAKRRLSTGNDVDKTFASMHLEAIPKTAKEYPVAKQLLAEIGTYFKRLNQRSESSTRKELEDELAGLAGEDAQLDRALDLYEDYDGPSATATKLNALKRKGEIELRRIEIERKLKKMKGYKLPLKR